MKTSKESPSTTSFSWYGGKELLLTKPHERIIAGHHLKIPTRIAGGSGKLRGYKI